MAAGSELHRRHGRRVLAAGLLRLAAMVLLLAALALFVAYLTSLWL